MKPVGKLAAAGALAFALSACSPEVDGITGLTRNGDGQLVGLGQACTGKLLGATLIQDANTGASKHVGSWRADAQAAQLTWGLQQVSPPFGWPIWQPAPEELSPGHIYTLLAWRELNVTNVAPVDFTVADLDALKAGQVLVNEPDAADETHRATVVTVEDFVRRACP